MASINTNAAAMTALQTLRQTNQNLETTQNRIATGLRVNTAADNAAYWSIATTMRSDNLALSAVQDGLGVGAATVDVAYTGLESAIDVAKEIKAKLVAAKTPGLDRAKIQAEIGELQNALRSTADSAVFNGENFLAVDSGATDYAATKSVVSSFSRAGGSVSVGTTDIDTTQIMLYDDATATTATGILDEVRTSGTTTGATSAVVATLDISALTDSTTDQTTLDNYIQYVDDALEEMTSAASELGSVSTRISLQQDFVSDLMDAIDRGIGQLVDADMNKESTRLQALQVQQQLGIQSLGIANANSQAILQLFR